MKFLALLAILIVLGCTIYLVVQAVTITIRNRQRRKNQPEQWEVRERTTRGQTQLWLVKRNEEPYKFGNPISERLGEFEYQEVLTERRLQAQARCETKNRRLDA